MLVVAVFHKAIQQCHPLQTTFITTVQQKVKRNT